MGAMGRSATQRPIENRKTAGGQRNIDAKGLRTAPSGSGTPGRLISHCSCPEQELGPIASHELWMTPGHRRGAVNGARRRWFSSTPASVEAGGTQDGARLARSRGRPTTAACPARIRLMPCRSSRVVQVKGCVATASLELGIDIAMWTWFQIGSPRSPALAAAGGALGTLRWAASPRRLLSPHSRRLTECVGLARRSSPQSGRSVRSSWPLDVLARTGRGRLRAEDGGEDDLYALACAPTHTGNCRERSSTRSLAHCPTATPAASAAAPPTCIVTASTAS